MSSGVSALSRQTSDTDGDREFAKAARGLIALVTLIFAFIALASAADDFPALTGRVVDQAGVLSPGTRAGLDAKLVALERKSGIQLEVATVATLGGQEIEPYANALFRAWKLGEAQKNNGVLFLVAPKEHKVRIEVGYGLEGTLTDAISKIIILNAIAPRFKAGDFDGGVTRGVDDIITTLTTDSSEWQAKPDFRAKSQETPGSAIVVVIIFVLIGFVVIRVILAGRRSGGFVATPWVTGGSGYSGSGAGGSSGSGGGDSFSGGGGSSGGGGASGDW